MPRKNVPAPAAPVQRLACADIQVDDGIQPRVELHHPTIREYAEIYAEAEPGHEPLPPLDVFAIDGVYYVVDGFHRLEAARQASRETLPCHVHRGSKRDAMVFACFANVRRGLRYQPGDKQRILERLLADPEMAQRSDRQLASELGVSHVYVWRIRAHLTEEARLLAALAQLPATSTAPQARAQEQLAHYLEVPVQTLKTLAEQSSGGYGGLRGATTTTLIKTLARDAIGTGGSPRQAAKKMAEHIEQLTVNDAAPPGPRPRPSRTKAAVAERKAEREREQRFCALVQCLDALVDELYPFTPEELELEPDDPSYAPLLTATELVASVLDKDADYITERLAQARTVLDALESAWQARLAGRACH